MAHKYVIPSLSNESTRYVFYPDFLVLWDRRRQVGGFSDHFASFDTLGDGNTQHTSERVLSSFEAADAIYSFLKFAQTNEEARKSLLEAFYNRCPVHEIQALFSARASKEGKPNYFSLQLRKQTGVSDKRYDERYVRVPEDHEKTTPAAFRLWSMSKGNQGDNLMSKMMSYVRIADWAYTAGLSNDGHNTLRFGETFGLLEPHDYNPERAQMISDLYSALKAFVNLSDALRTVNASLYHIPDTFERNLQYRREREAEKKVAAAQ